MPGARPFLTQGRDGTCMHYKEGKLVEAGWCPNGSGLFQKNNESCHNAKIVQESVDEHAEGLKVLIGPLYSPDLLWNVLDKHAQIRGGPTSQLYCPLRIFL